MCGLVGYLGGGNWHVAEACSRLKDMASAIVSRGPDDEGTWADADARIGLGHRRLAIVDLSAAGHQPMLSDSGRYVIAFNGEIYNHQDLREELEALTVGGMNWKGHSDTETLLAGVERWGLEKTLEKSSGMFALALWDRQRRILTLARDRFGEKPLYYGWMGTGTNRVFLFGSELKGLKRHPLFSAGIDRGSLALLLRHNYIPDPYSIFEGISKLEPGHLLSVSLEKMGEVEKKEYWNTFLEILAGKDDPFKGSPQEAVEMLETLAGNAVRRQMMADVPLGAFLSGGIDSSTVVALMQAQSARPIKTFTIGFREEGYNEAEHALAVARHLGTEHTELYIDPAQAMAIVPDLPDLYCEPFADSSQIPTFLVSRLAREHVTVALSGDAGDELFCGYRRYEIAENLWERLARVPYPVRAASSSVINRVVSNAVGQAGIRMLGVSGDRIEKGATLMRSRTLDQMYLNLISHLSDPSDWVIDGRESITTMTGKSRRLDGLSPKERMMAWDTVSYLPGDILTKVDRAGMGVSLEGRIPFLDHRLARFAWRLPMEYKFRDGQGKWPLRQVLYRHVPRALVDRPKKGFGVPLHDWLRGSLRDWAESLLDETRMRSEGFLEVKPVRQLWGEHLTGKRNRASQLWNILMFQAWLDRQ